MKKKIILASASPRRKELLRFITDNFEVRPSDADESISEELSPEETVKTLAGLKADAVKADLSEETVISADTVVAVDGHILGKPANEKEAFDMLRMLSGREHCVYTGVCILTENVRKIFSVCSVVRFYELSDEEILKYVSTGEPMDKAGAYGIQGKGCLLASEIHGDYFNIVGLPVSRLARELSELEI